LVFIGMNHDDRHPGGERAVACSSADRICQKAKGLGSGAAGGGGGCSGGADKRRRAAAGGADSGGGCGRRRRQRRRLRRRRLWRRRQADAQASSRPRQQSNSHGKNTHAPRVVLTSAILVVHAGGLSPGRSGRRHRFRSLALSVVTAAWIAATRSRSRPPRLVHTEHARRDPTGHTVRLGLATSDHAIDCPTELLGDGIGDPLRCGWVRRRPGGDAENWP